MVAAQRALPMYRLHMNQLYPEVLDWVDRLGTLKSADDAWRSFLAFVGRFGFSHGVVADLPRRHEPAPDGLLSMTWPESWRARYRTANYLWRDPSVRGLLHTGEPYTWQEGLMFEEYDRSARNIVFEAGDFGLHGGFVVPIGIQSGTAVVTIAGEQTSLSPRERAELHFAAIYAHARIRALSGTRRRNEKPSLTSRERECLEWAASGKSDWEIGEILSISERTAGAHIERAKLKFGVATRMQAVVLALQSGVIQV
jgi:LuxR family transcriptional regulator, quorum-sensing system regulator BjaR1